jgi:hypothetical protein
MAWKGHFNNSQEFEQVHRASQTYFYLLNILLAGIRRHYATKEGKWIWRDTEVTSRRREQGILEVQNTAVKEK